ncbi:MAG: hypothetical protein Q8M65_01545, partial [Rhodoglobus sp.]|nr:hypothetical protein [Rhodoglobus sp.]
MDDRDEVDRLIFAIEQIALCAELIRDGSAGKARAALILLDSLIDGMTYRRLDLLYTASTAGWTRGTGRAYPQSVRRTARMSLPTRIELVSETTGYEPYLSQKSPLLEPDEAEVLAVAHEYRNSAYHQDTHNEAVVGDIAAALLIVAGRMVVRSQSEWSVSASRSQVTQLAVFSVEIEDG